MYINEFAHNHYRLHLSFWDRLKILVGAKVLLRHCHNIQIHGSGDNTPVYEDIRLHGHDVAVAVFFGKESDQPGLKPHMLSPNNFQLKVNKTIDVVDLINNNNSKLHEG